MQRSPTCENCQRNYELKDCQPVGPRIPLLLSCGHTFCQGCLTKAARLHVEIPCFTCKKPQVLQPRGEKGIGNLLPNIYMLGLLLFNRRAANNCIENRYGSDSSTFSGIMTNFYTPTALEETRFDDKKKTKDDCGLCEECTTKSASCQCKNCDDTKFCDGCFVKIHRASKILSKHTPLPLYYTSIKELTCILHEGRPLEFYDEQLKEAVCAMCIISDRCRGHDILPVSEMKEKSEILLEEASKKARETLEWFQHSKELLSGYLSDEVIENNQLFCEIQSIFTSLHTMLVKRQLDVMKEALNKFSSNSGAQQQIQEIATKTKEIKKALRDYVMIKDDKHMMLRGNEFTEKLNSLSSQPCIINCSEKSEHILNFRIEDQELLSLNQLGHFIEHFEERFHWKFVEDVDEETKEKLQKRTSHSSIEAILSNELLSGKLNVPKKPSPLSLPKGHYELIYITHTRDPLDFMIQRCADKDRLQVMMTAINRYCRHSSNVQDHIYNVEEGIIDCANDFKKEKPKRKIVCAQFSADNNWYRAKVINAFSPTKPEIVPSYCNGLPVEVFYIDYGNTEWLTLNRLRKLQERFLEVPAMAVPCSLMDIVPPFKAVTWPERSIKAFNSLTGDRPMLMNIRQRVGGKLYVDLKRPEDDEPTHDDDRPVSVRDAMVFLDVAVFFSPSSFPNADIHRSVRCYSPHERLEVNKFVDVIVTHVENPHSIFIQRLDSSISSEQIHLTKLYFGKNKRAWKIDWPYRNLVCAAKFSGDNSWYRAVVKHVNHDETVVVEFVDYGNMETLSFRDIKKIPDMYLKLPIQCVQVSLNNLEKMLDQEEWPPEVTEMLEVELLNKAFVCKVTGMSVQDLPEVILIDTSTAEDVNMNDTLALKNIARPINPVDSSLPQMPTSVAPADDGGEMSGISSVTSEASTISSVENSHASSVTSFPKYPGARMPKVPNFTATGVFVDNDAVIYLHAMVDDDVELEVMMQELNRNISLYKNHPQDTSNLNVKQACLARYEQDGFWYRTRIQKILSEKEVEIEFIDFGNSEKVSVSELYMKAPFLDVPAQCISVQLANIEPKDGVWNEAAIHLMKEMIQEKTVVVSLQGIKALIFSDYGKNIGEILVEQGFAKKAVEKWEMMKAKTSKSKRQKQKSQLNDGSKQPTLQNQIQQQNRSETKKKQQSKQQQSNQPQQSPRQPQSCNKHPQSFPPSPATTSLLVSPEMTHHPFSSLPQFQISPFSGSNQSSVSQNTGNSSLTEEEPDSLQSAVKERQASLPPPIHRSSYLCYTSQGLPSVGIRFDITVTQVDQPNIVFIQRYPGSEDDPLLTDEACDVTAKKAYAELQELEDLSNLINCEGYFDQNSLTMTPVEGMGCIAQYSEDELFYRARVEKVDNEEGVADVLFVDYGTKETVSIESLKPITADLVKLPMQASRVRIAGVIPIPSREEKEMVKGTKWTVDAMKQFFDMVANKRMIAQVVNNKADPITIHLYDRCLLEDSDGLGTEKTADLLIGKVMADNGTCMFGLNETEHRIMSAMLISKQNL